MLYILENTPQMRVEDMEKFNSARPSKELWDTFRNESTSAEFVTMEIIQEAYDCRSDLIQNKFDKLKTLSEGLKDRIPFECQVDDITWEIFHTTLLTERVILRFLGLI
jgi:hypothetical protein